MLFGISYLVLIFFIFFDGELLPISMRLCSSARGKLTFSKKAKTSLKCPFFNTGVTKQFDHGETIAEQQKLFDFDTLKYRNY